MDELEMQKKDFQLTRLTSSGYNKADQSGLWHGQYLSPFRHITYSISRRLI